MSYNPKIKTQQNGQIIISGSLILEGIAALSASTVTSQTVTCSVLTNSSINISSYDYDGSSGLKTNIIKTTGSLNLGSSHHIVLVEPSGSNATITLPVAANNIGRQYFIKKNISSSYSVILTGSAAGDLIESSSSISLTSSYQSTRIVSDGTSSWYII